MRRERTMVRMAVGLVPAALALGVLGEIGHRLLERLGDTLAHHLFHLTFGAGAALVFAALVLADIRRNGWPTFSWRLRSPAIPAGEGPAPEAPRP